MENSTYDVIIVGGGIGGVVCGCYLAKNGLKVLIIEKNKNIGGCCVSFRRNNYYFDAGVHSLGDFGSDGVLTKLFSDLSLQDKIRIKQSKFSDIIFFNNYKVEISHNIEYTIDQFKQQFPKDSSGIELFFEDITKFDLMLAYRRFQNKTFGFLLNKYFKNETLKDIISIPVSNLGASPYEVSAISAIILFQKFILGGGFYPVGGMQKFSDIIGEQFKLFGGRILNSTRAQKIIINGGRCQGVLANSNFFQSKIVVSNCDARETFLELIGQEFLEKKFLKKMFLLKQSFSAFIVFLGLRLKLGYPFNSATAVWNFSGNLKRIYRNLNHNVLPKYLGNFLTSFPSSLDTDLAPVDNEAGFLLMASPFMNDIFWKQNRNRLADLMVESFIKFSNISDNEVALKLTATPATILKYTGNYSGALHGWKASPEQIDFSYFPIRTMFENLFLTGHWVTQPGQGGIGNVISTAMRTSKIILNRKLA